MERVISKDGIQIAYEHRGAGSPLVLVHGAAADHTRWDPVAPELSTHFSLYMMDRRGRGQSGDAEPYTILREYEDIAAIVDSIGGPVNLLAHSYGAICALGAALLTPNLRKLILYEPPVPTEVARRERPDALAEMNRFLQSGKKEEALLVFMREIAEIPAHEVDLLRTLPGWPARVATAHTIPREQLSVEAYTLDPIRLSQMGTDTLLLLGGDSPPFYKAALHVLRDVLPKSRLVVMPGQQHAAMNTAPELFIKEIMEFLG